MIRLLPIMLVAGCTFQMPAPLAFTGACPDGDKKCQRNLDAQTLAYIGENEAATKLMCMDQELEPYIQSCASLPALY